MQRGSVDSGHALIATVGAVGCAIPIAQVIETMRPLPIEPVGERLDFVRGIAIVRGAPTPVIDTARLLGIAAPEPRRFVTVRAGPRTLAFTFDAVLDVRPLGAFGELPPLLRVATPAAVAAITAADAALLLVLEAARALTEDEWTRLLS